MESEHKEIMTDPIEIPEEPEIKEQPDKIPQEEIKATEAPPLTSSEEGQKDESEDRCATRTLVRDPRVDEEDESVSPTPNVTNRYYPGYVVLGFSFFPAY